RNSAVCRAQVLAIGEVMRVSRQQLDGKGPPLGHLDLWQDGVSFQVDAHRYGAVLFAQYRAPGQVQQSVGMPEELHHFRLGQTEGTAPLRPRPVSPTSLQPA